MAEFHERQWAWNLDGDEIQVRAAEDGDGLTLSGYIARFGEVTEIEDQGNAAHFEDGTEEGFFYGVADATTFTGRFYDADGALDFERVITK